MDGIIRPLTGPGIILVQTKIERIPLIELPHDLDIVICGSLSQYVANEMENKSHAGRPAGYRNYKTVQRKVSALSPGRRTER